MIIIIAMWPCTAVWMLEVDQRGIRVSQKVEIIIRSTKRETFRLQTQSQRCFEGRLLSQDALALVRELIQEESCINEIIERLFESLAKNFTAGVSDAVVRHPQDLQPRCKSIPREGISKDPHALILNVVVVKVEPQQVLASGEVGNLNDELHR